MGNLQPKKTKDIIEPTWQEPSMECLRIAARWNLSHVQRLLDVGCGKGRHTLMFAQLKMDVSAFDSSAQQVSQTKALLASQQLNADVRVADMNEIPYDDQTFEAVLAYHVLDDVCAAVIGRTLSEIERVLKPDGELFMTLVSAPPVEPDAASNLHIVIGQTDIAPLLSQKFEIVQNKHIESFHPQPDQSTEVYWHYYLLLRKRF